MKFIEVRRKFKTESKARYVALVDDNWIELKKVGANNCRIRRLGDPKLVHNSVVSNFEELDLLFLKWGFDANLSYWKEYSS